MNTLIRNLKSGKVKVLVYSKSQVDQMNFTRSVISDLYRNIENFNTKIVWILKAIPSSGYTMEDLLKEYADEYIQDKTLFITQAGTLGTISASDFASNGIQIIDQEAQSLEKAGFINIWWNRCMGKSYGNNDIFIYPNNGANTFIEENTGEGKVISRVFRPNESTN